MMTRHKAGGGIRGEASLHACDNLPANEGVAVRASAVTAKEQMWLKVAATVHPLVRNKKGRMALGAAALSVSCPDPSLSVSLPDLGVSKPIALKPVAPKSALQKNVTAKSPLSHGVLPLLDPKSRKKISRGRLKIEARLDLHGLDRDRAYALLLHFVRHAQAREQKYVLVITGKGKSSRSEETGFRQGGVLQQLVPEWLAGAPFRLYVSAVEGAAQHHGGAGALYVKLRRQTEASL